MVEVFLNLYITTAFSFIFWIEPLPHFYLQNGSTYYNDYI
jgi:hypothetical protein